MNQEINTPIPERLKNRPLFHGVPIPFSSFRRPDGTPDFKVTDGEAWAKCVKECRCGICGEVIKSDLFFIGGERSMETGCFFDPAMHEECARYSFAVCPFLAAKKDYAANLPKPIEGVAMSVHGSVEQQRPKRMAMLRCGGYSVATHQDSLILVATNRRNIEWKDSP